MRRGKSLCYQCRVKLTTNPGGRCKACCQLVNRLPLGLKHTAWGAESWDYDADQLEFMRAMDQYKRDSGRYFPHWSEVLEVVKSLGYRKEQKEGAQ